MKRFLPALVVGFAFAHLFLLPLTGPLVSPQHELIFHLPSPAQRIFLPVLLDLLALTVALALLLFIARRRPRAELTLWAALLLLTPVSLEQTIYNFASRPSSPRLTGSLALLAVVGFAAVLVRSSTLAPRFAPVRKRLTTVAGFIALSGALLFSQLLWFGWQARDLNAPFLPKPPSLAAQTNTGPRLVWLILDELSYQQVFERRYPGLRLPNFDQLAAQSTVFDDAEPTADFTRVAVPSLLTGQELASTAPSADGRRLLLTARTHHSTLLQPSGTVFGDAAARGLFTAVVGWYEPYCRLLPGVLDRCYWTYSDELPGGMSPSGSVLGNALTPLSNLVLRSLRALGLGPGVPAPGMLDVRRHRADLLHLTEAADSVLAQNRPGLVLLHMPIPHPWGLYDRAQGRFSDDRTSYLDNLALADLYLGHVRSVLQAQGAWDNTALVVMGDHSWRTFVWAASEHWTPEEQAASRGRQFDERPVYLVKLPGQHTPALVPESFEAVRTRALLDALMQGRLQTPQQLQRWAATAN